MPLDFTNADGQVVQECDSRIEQMRSDRYSYWAHWYEISNYELPRRGRFLITPNQGNRGSPVNQRIIDTTIILAIRTAISGMMAGITSPSRPWAKMTLEDQDLADFGPVRMWLDLVSKRILRVFAKSNFYLAMQTLYEEMTVFGTAAMLVYPDFDDVIRCYNPTAGEYFLAQNGRFKVDTLAREFTLTAKQIADLFGEENTSESVKAMLRRGGYSGREFIIGHSVEPNSDFRSDDDYGLKGARWRQVYWERGSSQRRALEIKPFYDFPAVAARWDVKSNEVYASGCPGMDALGDAKQLQVETKRKAEGIEKQVRPPLVGDIQLKNQPAANIPNGITYIAGEKASLKPIYEVAPNLADMKEDLQDIRQRLKEIFFYDLFLMISQLDTVRTATEIIARKEEKLLMLGPMLERFQVEVLAPLIEMTFKIMMRRGLLPRPPKEMEGQALGIEYTSMLSEAQKSVATTGIERLVQFIGSIAGAKPEALDRLDVDNTIDEYADAIGVTPKILVPIDVAERIRTQRNQQMQEERAQQNALAAVEGAKNLSDVDVGGGQNAISMMINGASPSIGANSEGA